MFHFSTLLINLFLQSSHQNFWRSYWYSLSLQSRRNCKKRGQHSPGEDCILVMSSLCPVSCHMRHQAGHVLDSRGGHHSAVIPPDQCGKLTKSTVCSAHIKSLCNSMNSMGSQVKQGELSGVFRKVLYRSSTRMYYFT